MNVSRLWHTVRYLQMRQILGQIEYRVKSKLENPERLAMRRIPEFPGCRWTPVSRFLAPGMQNNEAPEILRGRLTFLNRPEPVEWPPQWVYDSAPKLWRYNLHYFEWMWAFSGDGFESARTAALDWIEKHPLSRGAEGWESYPTSLRLMNWCGLFWGEHRGQTGLDRTFESQLWRSVWLQAEWLTKHIEYHLLGNHLLENAVALAFVGASFDGPDAARWLKKGISILREQVEEQILQDGMHFERSPMYHSRMVYLFLILFNTGNAEARDIIRPVIEPMLKAMTVTSHPDGNIALLNDSAFDIYNQPSALRDYAREIGVSDQSPEPRYGSFSLEQAGYYGYRGEDGAYLICDAGPLGPDYIPGHAHADIFSFELSLHGHRVIVDSGVHDYEWSETRRFCRSTRAHNTCEIEEQDQAEMWGAFRVARRGSVGPVFWNPTGDGFELSAGHDGYARLSGSPRHNRTFRWRNSGCLEVTDTIPVSGKVNCRSYLHLHPDCRCAQTGDQDVRVEYPGGRFTISYRGRGLLTCSDGAYYPRFGVGFRNTTLVYSWVAESDRSPTGFVIESLS